MKGFDFDNFVLLWNWTIFDETTTGTISYLLNKRRKWKDKRAEKKIFT